MADEPQQQNPSWKHVLIHYRWPAFLAVLCSLGLIGVLSVLWTAHSTMKETLHGGGHAAAWAASVATNFVQGNVTHAFLEAIPDIVSTGNGNLELARMDMVETFRSADSRSIFWDYLPLGTTITEIRVPVTYRYYLRLSDPWKVEISGNTCLVFAPRIRANLPPAIHTDRMEKHSEEGWARFNATEQMDDLERSITPTLDKWAMNAKHLAMVREQCRQTIASFVRSWLLKQGYWRTDPFHTVKVFFADETHPPVASGKPLVDVESVNSKRAGHE